MKRIIRIPYEEILSSRTIAENVLRFCVECGDEFGLIPLKPCKVEVDGMKMDFHQLRMIKPQLDTKILIIQDAS
jgi:hypothetical protein